MALYAVERLDDALDATRELLWPVDAGRWLRLAVLALLVGGATGGAGGGSGTASGGVDGGEVVVPPDVPAFEPPDATVVALVAAVVLALLAAGLAVALAAAVAEFAFVESLRSERVALREYARRFFGPGVRLFAFRVALALGGTVVVGILVGAIVATAAFVGAVPALLVALVAVPLLIVAVVALAAAERFTTLFVVPAMLVTGDGVLAGWRRFWPTLVGQWRQYLAYAGVAILLTLAAGVVVGTVVAVPVVLLVVVFGVVFIAGVVIAGALFPLGVLVMALAAAGFLVCLLAVVAVVQVPVQTYLRYHALFVLGDTDDGLDLVADRREPLEE